MAVRRLPARASGSSLFSVGPAALGLERPGALVCGPLTQRHERGGAQPPEDHVGAGTAFGRSGVARSLQAPRGPEQRESGLHLMAVVPPPFDGPLVAVRRLG